MSILVLCEGVTDRGAIKSVAKRLDLKVRVNLMHGNRLDKLIGTSRVLAAAYDKFIVLKDLHTYQEDTIRRRYRATLRALAAHLIGRIRFLTVRHAIEAWFLADINTLNRVYNCRIEREIMNPEEIEDPAERLTRLLERYGKRYIKSEKAGERIMKEADLQKVSEKAPSFRTFLNYLMDP
jgi:hypothetical protein